MHVEPPARCLESRSNPRTNLFVSAALYSDGECSPARIRNLSEFGALVEAPVLPSPGTAVRLCRGSRAIVGKIVWRRAGKAGVEFESAVTIDDWLPRRGGRDQARVDEIVHQVRMGSPPISSDAVDSFPHDKGRAEALESIASMIDSVADALSADAIVVTHHGLKLQQLDLAIQKLRRLASSEALHAPHVT